MTAFYKVCKAIVLDPTMTDEEKSDLIEDLLLGSVDEFDIARRYGIRL